MVLGRKHIRAVHQDIGIERTNPLYKDLELDYYALNYNSIKQILGVRLCSTLEMSDAQREAPLPEANIKPSFLVRGEFENMCDDSESYKDTLWVPFDQVAAAGLNCDGEDDDGDWPDYARVIDTFFTTVNGLRTMARAKAVAAAAAEAAGVCTMPPPPPRTILVASTATVFSVAPMTPASMPTTSSRNNRRRDGVGIVRQFPSLF